MVQLIGIKKYFFFKRAGQTPSGANSPACIAPGSIGTAKLHLLARDKRYIFLCDISTVKCKIGVL